MTQQPGSAETGEVDTSPDAVERLASILDAGHRRFAPVLHDDLAGSAALLRALSSRLSEQDARPNNTVDLLRVWFTTANPMLGNISPLDMLKAGRGTKLARFIENAIEESQPAATSHGAALARGGKT